MAPTQRISGSSSNGPNDRINLNDYPPLFNGVDMTNPEVLLDILKVYKTCVKFLDTPRSFIADTAWDALPYAQKRAVNQLLIARNQSHLMRDMGDFLLRLVDYPPHAIHVPFYRESIVAVVDNYIKHLAAFDIDPRDDPDKYIEQRKRLRNSEDARLSNALDPFDEDSADEEMRSLNIIYPKQNEGEGEGKGNERSKEKSEDNIEHEEEDDAEMTAEEMDDVDTDLGASGIDQLASNSRSVASTSKGVDAEVSARTIIHEKYKVILETGRTDSEPIKRKSSYSLDNGAAKSTTSNKRKADEVEDIPEDSKERKRVKMRLPTLRQAMGKAVKKITRSTGGRQQQISPRVAQEADDSTEEQNEVLHEPEDPPKRREGVIYTLKDGDRSQLVCGTPDPSKLRICYGVTVQDSNSPGSVRILQDIVYTYQHKTTRKDFHDREIVSKINKWRSQNFGRGIGAARETRHPWTVGEMDKLCDIVEAHLQSPNVEGKWTKINWKYVETTYNNYFNGRMQAADEVLAKAKYRTNDQTPKISSSKPLGKEREAPSRTQLALKSQLNGFVEPRAATLVATAKATDTASSSS